MESSGGWTYDGRIVVHIIEELAQRRILACGQPRLGEGGGCGLSGGGCGPGGSPGGGLVLGDGGLGCRHYRRLLGVFGAVGVGRHRRWTSFSFLFVISGYGLEESCCGGYVDMVDGTLVEYR